MRLHPFFLISALFAASFNSQASSQSYEQCLLEQLQTAQPEQSAGELQARCHELNDTNGNALSQRRKLERASSWNPHVITAHKQNYILPYSATSRINREAYSNSGEWQEKLQDKEAKFQISFKVPLTRSDILAPDDGLFFGFTLQSWWQVYNSALSSPFRETNYQPELFYRLPLEWQPHDGDTTLLLGIEHQSNGRNQALSRSWNRVYAELQYDYKRFAISLRPWYRLPEDEKNDESDADGDDNPDIEHYMGHFELRTVYSWEDYEFSALVRNNLRSDNRGALELGFSFPLGNKLKGYVQYFNGYGESLIDYDNHQERLGIGILLTDFL